MSKGAKLRATFTLLRSRYVCAWNTTVYTHAGKADLVVWAEYGEVRPR